MLRQGPVDKNDGKPCETWELTRRSATLLGNIKPWPPGKIWSQDHESKSRWLSAKTRYCLILVLEIFSSFTSVRTPSHVPLFVLFPSYFNDSFGNMHRPDTCPTVLKSHKSGTLLVHHLIPFYFTVSRPGATDPRAKHQASAPSLRIQFLPKSMFVIVLLTFNASARACGQTMATNSWTQLTTLALICRNRGLKTVFQRHSEPSKGNKWACVFDFNQWPPPQTQQCGVPKQRESLPQDVMTRKASTCRYNLWASTGLSWVEDNVQHRLDHETIASSITCM